MIIIPCSMKTLAGVASGYSDNLTLRAADVCLKERRKLVLVTREMPLSPIHTENMARVSRAGGIILPPVLTFYSRPKNVDDHVNHVIGKALDSLSIENDIFKRWKS
jgi:4-hydroxy-3-polyprenylbenzoate decarboxylase